MDISVEREERTDQTGPDQMPEQDKAQLLTNSAMLYLRFTLAVEVAILPELVELVAGDTVGSKLKERQYEQATYAQTQLGGIIPPIGTDVQRRLNQLKQTV